MIKSQTYLIVKVVLLATVLVTVNRFGYSQDSLDLSTPYRSLKLFSDNIKDGNFLPSKASKVFYPRYTSDKDATKLSIELKQVIGGRGIFIDIGKVPDDPNYVDSISQKSIFPINANFPELYLEKIGEQWYFSKTTTERISNLHKETFPFGTDRLLDLVPHIGNRKILGIEVWQYLGILFIVIVSFIFHKLLNSLISVLFTRILKKYADEKDLISRVKPAAVSASYAGVFLLIKLMIPILQLPTTLGYYLNLSVGALFPFFIMISIYRFVDVLDIFFVRLSQKTESTLDDQLVPLVRKALKAFVVIMGVLIIMQNLNVDILPLLAGLSVGGLAVALAAQDSIKNFLGSIMIFLDKPFQIGHWITSGEFDGTVEEVGIRATRIRTFRNSLVYIPNGKLADSMIDNHGLRVYRRFYTQIAITYNTPPDLIELFIEGLRQIVKDHPNTRKDNYHVYLNDMSSSSLNIMFYIFFEVPDWGEELRCRHEVLLSIIKLAEKLGVNFAFPTQTLHIENLPGQESLSPKYESMTELKPKLQAFLAKSELENSGGQKDNE